MTTLYVEVSMCQRTGAAGWAAAVSSGLADAEPRLLSGSFWAHPNDPVTSAELGGLQAALQAALARRLVREVLRIEMRALAALSILRWVFPDASVVGKVDAPKKIARRVQELDALYDLHDDVERAKVAVVLAPIGGRHDTETLKGQARWAMEHLRDERRRA